MNKRLFILKWEFVKSTQRVFIPVNGRIGVMVIIGFL